MAIFPTRPSAVSTVIAVMLGCQQAAQAQDTIPIGHIVDFSGPTSGVGVPFGSGIADAMAYINAEGGIAGVPLEVAFFDYGYLAPRAVATYRRWVQELDVVAVQGWGTADTEALVDFVARDQVPYWSASYAGTLTDPTGSGENASKAAPFNFFYGPSYSDGCRALVGWAAEDWATGNPEEDAVPRFVHMGDQHPYPNAPLEACRAYAEELGFEILEPIRYGMAPNDFSQQCRELIDAQADYAFLANTGGSGIALMRACADLGVETRLLSNVWGFDENVAKAAGEAADGVVFVVRTGALWNDPVQGMETVRAVSALSDESGEQYRSLHYIAGVCSVFYMKEAMDWAAERGDLTGAAIRDGIYALSAERDGAWVPTGLEGVCLPSGWTEFDHRGTMTVNLYRADIAEPLDEAAGTAELIRSGALTLTPLGVTDLPRRPEWIGY